MMSLIVAAGFVTIDPGHFHASLVQNRSYPDVSPVVRVFAPEGAELDAHLKLVENFNAREINPTSWKEEVYRGSDYLDAFSEAARKKTLGENPIVVLAGKNNRKGEYAIAAVEAGCHVLSDKPMAITPEVFAKTELAARLAERRGLYFADIMTERNEITTILQRARRPSRPGRHPDTSGSGRARHGNDRDLSLRNRQLQSATSSSSFPFTSRRCDP